MSVFRILLLIKIDFYNFETLPSNHYLRRLELISKQINVSDLSSQIKILRSRGHLAKIFNRQSFVDDRQKIWVIKEKELGRNGLLATKKKQKQKQKSSPQAVIFLSSTY